MVLPSMTVTMTPNVESFLGQSYRVFTGRDDRGNPVRLLVKLVQLSKSAPPDEQKRYADLMGAAIT